MSKIREAQEAWSGNPPSWITALAEAVDNGTSLRALAETVGYSPTALSQALHAKYPGNLGNLETAVHTHLPGAMVECSMLGVITAAACQAHRNRPFCASSGARVALWRACQTCRQNV